MTKITIYTTRTCPFCVQLERWLDTQGIKYTDYKVDTSPIAAQNMVRLSGQMGVPFSTIEFDDGRMETVLGFDRQRFSTLLAKS